MGISPIQNAPDDDGLEDDIQSVFSPESSSASDSIANKEAAYIASGTDIERDGKQREHNRHQHFRNHINSASIALFWSVVVCLLVGILAFSWHVVTPSSWHFLAESQLDKLQTLLTSALLSSALTGYVNKRME